MADSYLSIADIATDANMVERLRAAATQQTYLDTDGMILSTVQALGTP
jgi:hypothetical protein